MKLNQILIVALSALFVLACKKEDGPEGPQGPQGETGNANVQSQMITVQSSQWVYEDPTYSFITSCGIITGEIAESGVVMCYEKRDDIYTPMPISVIYNGETVTTHVGFEHKVDEIYFFIQAAEGVTPAPGERTFKVVAIESSGLAANPGVDLYDYEEVKQTFDIED